MEPSQTSHKKELAALIGVFAVIIILVVAISLSSKSTKTASASSPAPTSMTKPAANTVYKDGSYTAKGTYQSPGGQEAITVDVTLKSNIVTATSARSGASDDEAMAYQSQFISGYKQHVIGKPISSLNLSNVSGSSLTSQGFNDAIKQIEKQAQS
jgi:uncharacterized protein with FMN-binding domain